MKSGWITAATLGLFAGVATAAYLSPFPPYLTHVNSTTCSTEPTQRACKVCCLQFYPDTTVNIPGIACAGTCASLPKTAPGVPV